MLLTFGMDDKGDNDKGVNDKGDIAKGVNDKGDNVKGDNDNADWFWKFWQLEILLQVSIVQQAHCTTQLE